MNQKKKDANFDLCTTTNTTVADLYASKIPAYCSISLSTNVLSFATMLSDAGKSVGVQHTDRLYGVILLTEE
jgi:hypothetical protein